MSKQDSQEYRSKKLKFSKMITIFGRKPVLEALQNEGTNTCKLHLAESNKPAKIIDDIVQLSRKRNVDIQYHDKSALSRISKSAKQDQGVALDIECEKFGGLQEFVEERQKQYSLIALDSVTNPQNLGMIIRSVCASPAQGILLPDKGCAKLDALVIKASAGTVFKARIIRCKNLAEALLRLSEDGAAIYGLEASAEESLGSFIPKAKAVYVMGNETLGLSSEVSKCCTNRLSIPMCNGVESLNVAVAASLIAFQSVHGGREIKT